MAGGKKDDDNGITSEQFNDFYDNHGRKALEFLNLIPRGDEAKKQINETQSGLLYTYRSLPIPDGEPHVSRTYHFILKDMEPSVLKDPEGFDKLLTELEKIIEEHEKLGPKVDKGNFEVSEGGAVSKAVKAGKKDPRSLKLDQLTKKANGLVDDFLKAEFKINPLGQIPGGK